MSKFFEKVIEFVSMILISLSPIIIFSLIGIISYNSIVSPLGMILGIIIILLGFILGIWLAIYIHKRKSATEFISRINASPELDNKKE